MDILTIEYIVAIGFIGGITRTMRDMFKRFVNKETVIDSWDMLFDIFFGVVSGLAVYMAFSFSDFSNSVILAVAAGGYAGADIVDAVYEKVIKKIKDSGLI